MYEGDIDLSNETVTVDTTTLRPKRNAARDRKRLWNTRVVPYQFDPRLPRKLATKL